jgi:transposase
MKAVHDRCAGLDVHKDIVVACVRTVAKGKVDRQVQRFSTMTWGLLELSEWLEAAGVTHVAMESTGVYWKPVWHVLDGHFELLLANAAHIRNIPGRKSDVNDATWIADLLAHGLIRGSFVPPQPIQELRDLTRTRKQMTREVVQHVQRIQRILEDANVKLSSVATDILGASGRRILVALTEGETDPEKLADLAKGRLKCSREALVGALRGKVTGHHGFLIDQHLQLIQSLDKAIAELTARIEVALEPFRAAAEHLKTIPGVSDTTAQILIAEIGVRMEQFPTAGHLLSWAGLCPRLDESAGKKKNTRLRKGAPWLKPVLVQAAWAAVRTKNTYLRSQFMRLKGRRGPKNAIVAVAASILTATYYILRDQVDYKDLGADYFVRRDKDRLAQRLARRIKELGYEVEIHKAA